MLSHKDYSFVTVRHLRRVEINDPFLLLSVVLLLISHLNVDESLDSIEWSECDELLSSGISVYFRRSGNTGWGFEILSR